MKILIIFLYILSTCLSFAQPDPKKLNWTARASKVLHPEKKFTAQNIRDLANKTKAEVINELMQKIEFGDMLLSFNLYFYRNSTRPLKTKLSRDNSKIYAFHVLEIPQVVQSAIEGVRGTNYFTALFSPMDRVPYRWNRRTPDYEKLLNEIYFKLNSLKFFLLENPQAMAKDLCYGVKYFFGSDEVLQYELRNFKIQKSILNSLHFSQDFFGNLSALCMINSETQTLDKNAYLKEFDRLAVFYTDLFELMKKQKTTPSPTDLNRISFFPFNELNENFRISPFDVSPIENSSTNFNRRRAAYVLDNFFCDNVSPVGAPSLVGVEAHHENKLISADPHGTDPKCFSCHYKLDPMAGFFRYNGKFNIDFSHLDNLKFDDNAKTKLYEYINNWRDKSGNRTWNIGYIRSATDEKLNTYGESIDDLINILITAPEVKQCFVKRMSEFILGKSQVIDGAYLEALTRTFTQESLHNSSQAVKNLIEKLLLSNTFAQGFRDPNTCYDYGPGGQKPNSPPCTISHTISKYCISCHDGDKTEGGLDMTQWIQLPSGKYNFVHDDGFGQLPQSETMDLIEYVLLTDDTTERMPYKKFMPHPQREKLYKWVKTFTLE